MRMAIQKSINEEVTRSCQGEGFDGQIGVQEDPIEIGNLIKGQCLIYIVLWFSLCCLHHLPSILFTSLLVSTLLTKSDIYCHEDVLNFTNPFLNYEQGHCPLYPRVIPTIPVSLKTILPAEPLTHQGYPRGCQGHSSPCASRPKSIPQDYYPLPVPLEEPE